MTRSKIPQKAGKLLILVVLLLAVLQTVWFGVSAPVFAQSVHGESVQDESVDTTWVRRYNGSGNGSDEAYALAVDGSRNVYVTGGSFGSGTLFDYVTIKYYPHGDTAWVRRYNGPENNGDIASAIAVDDSGNVYVTGKSYDNESNYDYATMKYYPDGETAWVRRYDGPGNSDDEALAVAVDDFGNVYVTGESWGSEFYYDYATMKYYSNGDTVWVRRYNGPGNGGDIASALAVDDSGNVYVTGKSYGGESNYDYATMKYYPNGETAWVRVYNGPENSDDEANALAVDGFGNVYVTGGSFDSEVNWDYVTIKYYPNGDTAWVRRFNGPANGEDKAYAIALDPLNNVYVTGYSDSTGSYQDYATIKYDSSGNVVWVKRYNGPPGNGSDLACAIAVDDSNNAYVTGMSGGGATGIDYATIKYDSLSSPSWVKRYDGPANGYDRAYDIAVDDSGNVYVTGLSAGISTDLDYATIKYVQFLCGDVNKDGVVNSADVVYLINYLFIGGPAPNPIQAGDVNRDGAVNSADVVYLINYLFVGGPSPCG
jgi:hypothetical protein